MGRQHSATNGCFREVKNQRPLFGDELEEMSVAFRPRPGIRTSPKPPLSTGVFCEFRCHEAAVRDLTTPARSGPSLLRQRAAALFLPAEVPSNGEGRLDWAREQVSCRIFLQSANLGRAPRVLSRLQRRSFTLHKRAFRPSGLAQVRACSLDGESEDGAKLSRCFAPQTGDHFPAAPFRDLRLGVHCVQAAHCAWLTSPSDGAPKGDLGATRLSQGDGVSVFFT